MYPKRARDLKAADLAPIIQQLDFGSTLAMNALRNSQAMR